LVYQTQTAGNWWMNPLKPVIERHSHQCGWKGRKAPDLSSEMMQQEESGVKIL
jgi:hypothetical protein